MAKNKHIVIPLSEADLSDLENGEVFEWTFDDIDVTVRPEEQEDLE